MGIYSELLSEKMYINNVILFVEVLYFTNVNNMLIPLDKKNKISNS